MNKINTWDYGYRKLVEYYEQYGNTKVPKNYVTKDGFELGDWVVRQRIAYKKDKLSKKHINFLNKYDFVWSIHEDTWNYGYQKLVEYYKQYGNANVPKKYITEDGFELGNWVNNQRIAYKKDKLSKKHINLLNKLDFVWNIYDNSWDYGFHKLELYIEECGDTNVPRNYVTKDGFELGIWVKGQIKKYNSEKNSLDPYRAMLLNDVNIDWSIHDTRILNKELVAGCDIKKYRRIMLGRMKHILEDLSYENNIKFNNFDDVKKAEKIIVERMWR